MDRNFDQAKPNQFWVTDITYIPIPGSMLYMCAVLDLCGKAVLAWKIGADMSSSLVTDTIREALKREKVTGGLALHSDQGSQYTSQAYFDLMQAYHVSPSMSSPGCPYDNAAMENFFGTLKTECLYRAHFTTRTEVEQLVTEYVDFYNFRAYFSKKTVLPRLKFGARPRKLSLFYDRALISLSVVWGTVQIGGGAESNTEYGLLLVFRV